MDVWVKRVKHVGSKEETYEGASNDAVVASLGRSVGGHARAGGEREQERQRVEHVGGTIRRRRKTRMATAGR